MSETIGFIGLGLLGLPMATNLLHAGYGLRVYNRTASKAEPLVREGVQLMTRPADVATTGCIVATIVWDDVALESIVTSDGFLENLGPGGIHIVMSTVLPETSKKLAAIHAQHDCVYVEAPIFGGSEAAIAHQLWIPIAGPQIAIVLSFLSGASWQFYGNGRTGSQIIISTGGLLFLSTLLMILFRQKYPRWWFDWNLELQRFANRVAAYIYLMDDRYPSTTDQQSVHLDYVYPDAEHDLNRWLPLIKWFLAIPHYIVLLFLHIAVVVVLIITWFAILFTAHYPRGIFDFVEGVLRWQNRVLAYAFTLVTDQYPPFSLRP